MNFGLNFGSNEISTITDLSFHNNKRIGEIVQSVQHPRDSFPVPEVHSVNEETFFSPSFDSKDDNYWIEFYLSKKPNAFGFNIHKSTQKSAKFNLEVDDSVNNMLLKKMNGDGNTTTQG